MLKIYGPPRSSAGRCYLVMEELGVPYETVPLDMMKAREHKSESYLKLNPNGKVPCLVDGDFVIWESLAINHYLAEKYRPELLGRNLQERALVQQWSVWALAELQPPMVDMIIQLLFVPEEKRDMAIVAKARERVPPMLKILDQALGQSRHHEGQNGVRLVGQSLTLADLNVASVVNIAYGLKIELDPYPAVQAWMGALRERPSFQKFMKLRGG